MSNQKQKVYTSLYLPVELSEKLELCALTLNIDTAILLSVLCYKAGKYICKKTQCLQTVDYQERGEDYKITPVYFFAADHEYMHGNRLACKVSVSKLLSCAMVMFLDEIMERGINQMEVAQLRIIENSYKKKSFAMRNFILDMSKNDQYEEYQMNMRVGKT